MHASVVCPALKGQTAVNKIPVFGTVSRTFGFLIGDFGTILRLSWAPMLIAAGLNYYYGPQVMDAAMNAKDNPGLAAEVMGINMLISIAGFLANVMVLTALLRVVIYGDRKPGLVVYFWFGTAEFRLVLVYVLLLVAAIAAMIAVGLAFGLLAGLTALVPAASLLLVAASVALVMAMIWATLRLMLIPAVIVAEKNLGVERSWELMAGNAIRMFLVLVLTYVPFMILGVLVVFALLGADMPAIPDFASMSSGKVKPDDIRAAAEQWQTGFIKAIQLNWMEFTVLNFFSSIFSAALIAGTAGNAYNAVAGDHAGQAE
jgi:hypothetical protein